MTRIPKSTKIFFLILHLVFGYDFGFSNIFKKKIAIFIKYYSLILTSAMLVALIAPVKVLSTDMLYWFSFMQFVMNIFILKSAKYTVYKLLSDIHSTERIAVLEKEIFGIAIVMGSFIILIARVSLAAVNRLVYNEDSCNYNELHPIYTTFHLFCYYGNHLYTASENVIYFYIYTYVKNMKSCLNEDKDINKFITRYNTITNCYDRIRRLCDNIVSIF